MSFFILGLPRSRTAWLANFMTYNGFYCHHEGLNGCSSMLEYKHKIYTDGDSSTGLAMFPFRAMFPTARTVIIDNSITAAVAYGKEHYNFDSTEQMLDLTEKLDAIDGLHIPYNDINNRLADIWSHLTKDAPFDSRRAAQLIGMNITVVEPYHFDAKAFWSLNEQAI